MTDSMNMEYLSGTSCGSAFALTCGTNNTRPAGCNMSTSVTAGIYEGWNQTFVSSDCVWSSGLGPPERRRFLPRRMVMR
jgi:hypothetical protein